MYDKIYRRTVRPDHDGRFRAAYVASHHYCEDPLKYIRAARIIEDDLRQIFDYVDPSDDNLSCFSFKILGLFTRVCFEVEANLKGILRANGYPQQKPTMTDYKKVEQSHHLSKYTVAFPEWSGRPKQFTPFEAWQGGGSLDWYQDYNYIKHDSRKNFEKANFGNLCESFAGLVALLTSQFWNNDTISEDALWASSGPKRLDSFSYSLISLAKFQFNHEFPETERYQQFTVRDLSDQDFCNFPYS